MAFRLHIGNSQTESSSPSWLNSRIGEESKKEDGSGSYDAEGKRKVKSSWKEWLPDVSYVETIFNIPLMIVVGLGLVAGATFVFGVKGMELREIMLPKVPIAGWIVVIMALSKFLPRKWKLKPDWKFIIKRIKNAIFGEKIGYPENK